MSQIPHLSRFNNSKNLVLNTIDQQGVHASSNKLLSPFTWSNLNIKLPQLNRVKPSITPIKQNDEQNSQKAGSKTKKAEKTKLQAINKTIDVNRSLDNKQTKSEHINSNQKSRYNKQSVQKNNTSNNFQVNDNMINEQPKFKLYKRDLITRHIKKGTKQKPDQISLQLTFTRTRPPSVASNFSNKNVTPLTFSFNKMQTFIYKAFTKSNWCQVPQKDPIVLPQLVWSDQYVEQTKINKEQLHNHIKNAHTLTAKHSLHELQSANGNENYPQSFLMPLQYESFCEEYEQQIIKICVKQIIKNGYERIEENKKLQSNLGLVLQQINNKTNPITMNQDTLMALRLCLYLEYYRKVKNYRYFQNLQHYIPIEINLQESVLSSLFKGCFQYWQAIVQKLNHSKTNNTTSGFYFNIENIYIGVLNVLWSYHCMLLKYQPGYQNLSHRNVWIVKPIASSRGAGISLLKNTIEYLSMNHNRFQLTNKTKLANKIIQKYIQQPLLLKKDERFKDRKFDIRQWVLITCDKQTNQPLIYLYQDAYCRFSDMKFTYNHSRSDQYRIHLTNYSISDKSNPQLSLMLLSQLFSDSYPNLKQKYYHQVNKIVVESILNAKDIKFQPNHFELFGFDLIFDKFQKLWLLQINLNPACQSSRSVQLQKMGEKMVAAMGKIIRAAARKVSINKQERSMIGWQIVFGQQKFIEADLPQQNVEPKIKPYYDVSLGNESLIQEVRRRNSLMYTIQKTVSLINLKQIWDKLKNYKPEPKEQQKQENIVGE